jgi:hypothetical protein
VIARRDLNRSGWYRVGGGGGWGVGDTRIPPRQPPTRYHRRHDRIEPAALEPGALEAEADVLVALHDVPDQLGAVVLDHRDDRALVDAEIVAGDPADTANAAAVPQRHVVVEARIERIEEAVLAVDVRAVALVHFLRRGDHDLRRERQRGDGRVRRDRAVVEGFDAAHAARRVGAELPQLAAITQLVITRPVARGEAPDVRPVTDPVEGIADRVRALRQDCAAAVLEVVDTLRPHELVLDAAVVDPDRAELVAEHRAEGEVGEAFERAPVLVVVGREGVPGARGDRVRRAAEREHVHDHALVVAAPVVDLELQLGAPGHADVGHVFDRPRPVHAAVEVVRDLAQFPLLRIVAVEVARDEQHTGHEQRGVDGRELGVAVAQARAEVQEVVEKSLVAGRRRRLRSLRQVVEELQRGQNAVARLRARDPAALDADGVGVQRESAGGDARERRLRPAVGDEAGAGFGGVPEVLERSFLDVLEQRIELVHDHGRCARDGGFDGFLPGRLASAEGEQRAEE